MAMDVKNSERLLSSILDSARAEADATKLRNNSGGFLQ